GGVEAPILARDVVFGSGLGRERHLLVGLEPQRFTGLHVGLDCVTHREATRRVLRLELHAHLQSGMMKSGMCHTPSARRFQIPPLRKPHAISKKRDTVIPTNAQNLSISARGVSSPRARMTSSAWARVI